MRSKLGFGELLGMVQRLVESGVFEWLSGPKRWEWAISCESRREARRVLVQETGKHGDVCVRKRFHRIVALPELRLQNSDCGFEPTV